jgi:hypothetical protein
MDRDRKLRFDFLVEGRRVAELSPLKAIFVNDYSCWGVCS